MKIEATLVLNKLPALERLVAIEAHRLCEVGADATVADARREIEEQIGSGVKYPNLPKQSSAPGEAPVNQLGGLLESIQRGEGEDLVGIGAEAVVESPIGEYLELGTSKLEPRPFLGPAAVVGEEAIGLAMAETKATLQGI